MVSALALLTKPSFYYIYACMTLNFQWH